MPETCVECGNDDVCAGYVLCSECLELVETDEQYAAYLDGMPPA